MRNGTYSLHDGHELELVTLADASLRLISRNNRKPNDSFRLYPQGHGIYFKDVELNDLTCAFFAKTKAEYKKITWDVDRKENNKLRLSIGNPVDVAGLRLVSMGWYEIWADASEIERVWEEREPSGYPLPFPENFPRYLELKIEDL